MSSFSIFIYASLAVIIALAISLIYWVKIAGQASNQASRHASWAYVISFALYIIGQSVVVLQALHMIKGWYSFSSYAYALAAFIFAYGSYLHYQSYTKK